MESGTVDEPDETDDYFAWLIDEFLVTVERTTDRGLAPEESPIGLGVCAGRPAVLLAELLGSSGRCFRPGSAKPVRKPRVAGDRAIPRR